MTASEAQVQTAPEVWREVQAFAASAAGDWDDARLRHLVSLVGATGDTVALIADSSVLSIDHARVLAVAAVRQESALLGKLIKTLSGSPECTVRMLEILSRSFELSRLGLALARLASDKNLLVRSKAALLLTRIHGTSDRIQKQMGSLDPRVRANGLEAGWGLQGKEYIRICEEAVRGDAYARVRGNALVGLFHARHPNWRPRMIEMAGHPLANFRIAAIWAMGVTGDKGFLPDLHALMESEGGQIRWHAMRAISRIRRELGLRLDS